MDTMTKRKQTPEAIERMVATRKKNGSYIAWNKGLTGIYSEETLQKMRDARKGFKHSIETRQKLSQKMVDRECPWLKGVKLSEEHKRRISEGGKGKHKGHKNHLVLWKRILDEAKIWEDKGYRVIPITQVIPDIIAIKDNKVIAIELEIKNADNPNFTKYDNGFRKYFDEVIWVIKKITRSKIKGNECKGTTKIVKK